MIRRPFLVFVLVVIPATIGAQEWNGVEALEIVERAVTRRAATREDGSLTDFRARAHGFVFFLAQLGEGLTEPPRLVKADELQLEVYWRTPGNSKQRIVGWRERADLPTDIRYHRDHLGMVQNNFNDNIRLGEGDEVRDVPHPLSRRGMTLYDFAAGQTTLMQLPDREVRVREIRVRPRAFDQPRVAGSLYIDVASAELVVFRFNFTGASYLDNTIEDITVVLENGLWNERFWLPWRQEIEIRRRTAWLDMPARGIIRGRWEIDDYEFNVGLADSVFRGPEIVAAATAVRDSFVWDRPFDEAVREASGPVATFDLNDVRGEIAEMAGAQAMSGLAQSRPGVGSVSDIAHFNRVEGLAVGFGWVFRPGSTWEVRVGASYGLSDESLKARIASRYRVGRYAFAVTVSRSVDDVSDALIISPILNSVLAQESGNDFGDYFLAHRALGSIERQLGSRQFVRVTSGLEQTETLAVKAAPARGSFDPNPSLGSGSSGLVRITIGRRPSTLGSRYQISGSGSVETGFGRGRAYIRTWVSGRFQIPVGQTDVVARGWVGWGNDELPPHRAFVFGGRGTLVGETFRAWGGRSALSGTIEWRIPVPFPAIPLGPLATTGRQLVVAPFVGAGWSGGSIAGMPWQPSGGVRPVVGLGVEWFHRLIRIDLGVRLRDPTVSLVIDVRRDLWDIL